MLSFPSNVRLFLAHHPVDFRKSFNGLAAYVEENFHMKAMNGDIFIFLNRRGTQVKILFWDRDGFCLIAKRLEEGSFRRVQQASNDAMQVELTAGELAMLLEGIDARDIRHRKRFSCKNIEKSAA